MRRWLLPLALAAVLLLAGFAALDDYGVNWDEAQGDLFFGQRYFSFFTTGDWRYLEFDRDPYPAGHRPDYSGALLREAPWQHYPVASTLATATSHLFSRLGMLDPFDGFHSLNLILAGVLLVVMFRTVETELGLPTALLSVLFLFLSPRIVYAMMANVKDFGLMVFFSLTVLVLFRGIENRHRATLIAGGALLGMALGTKANALFIPLIIILFLLVRGVPASWEGRWGALTGWLILAGVTGVIVFFISWPYLWPDPIGRLAMNLAYIASRAGETVMQDVAPPFQMILYTTPLAWLVAAAAGLVPFWKMLRGREPMAVLVGAWLAITAVRLVLPGATNFDGVRHFLELFPPMAIVGALGVRGIARSVTRNPAGARHVRWLAGAVGAMFVVPILVLTIAIHPFQIVFWNSLIGGLAGAQKAEIAQSGDYWASSYRQGLRWLNRNAPAKSVLIVPVAGHTVQIVQPYRLREDIATVSLGRLTTLDQMPWLAETSLERPVYVMFILRREWANELMIDCVNRLEPTAVWSVAGVPVLTIYRYRPPASASASPTAALAGWASSRRCVFQPDRA